MVRRLRIKSGKIWVSIETNRSARHPDSNGVNDTQIGFHMKKLEQVKDQV